jgi:hypothetical protein
VHRQTFPESGGNNLHFKNTKHMHDWLMMIPEETKKTLPGLTATSFNNAREPEKVTSNIQNTYFVMTQSWFSQVSNTSANCPILILQSWRRKWCHWWAQQQAYQDTPRRWTHMLHERGKSIGQTEGHEDVLKWNTMSISTIKIVLGTEFDLTIAQAQIKDC